MTGLAQSVGQVTTQMTQATRATSGWTQALSVAGGIGIATSLQGIVSSLKDFAAESVRVATRLEQLRASLSAIGGSTAIGQQQFQQLFQTAQQLGIAFEPLLQGWRRLTAAAAQTNLPLADQRRLLQAVAAEGRRVGASNEELSRAFLAIGQVASKGTLQMEELRQQLGEALPTALGALARGMGRTTEDLIKLIETGTIRFPTFARALTRGFEEIQATSRGVAETSQQVFNRLGNALTAFKDAIGQNVLPELVRLARVAQNILDTATNILNITGGRGGAGPQGPTLGELGFTADQQREAERLQRLIDLYTRQAGQGTPAMQQQRAEMIARAREQLEQLNQSVRSTEDQATAQAKVTAETNKTNTQLELQKDFVTDIRKQLDEVSKAQAAFRKEAALDPGRLGRMGGTSDEAITFLQERQRVLGKPLEDLVKAAANPPPGVTLPADLRQQISAVSAEYAKLGGEMERIRDVEREAARAAREAETARKREAAEVERDFREQRQERWKNLDIFGIMLSPEQEADLKNQMREQRERIQEAAKGLDIFGLELSPEQEQRRRAALDFQRRLDEQLQRQQGTREERPEIRLRQEAERAGLTLSAEQEAQLRRITAIREEQERLHDVLRIFDDLATSVGNAWGNALTSIADGTMRVSDAFKAMAKSILQSMAQIASQEAFRALIRIGAGLITGAFTGTAGNALAFEPAGAVGAGINPVMFQGGGMITKPTLAMIGEGPSYTKPEVVMNRPQMEGLMASMVRGGSGGGASSGGGVTVMNFPSREAAEEAAPAERARNRQVVLNEVLQDLRQGSGSQIGRMMRLSQQ
jgi:tape measure domain-containing protein